MTEYLLTYTHKHANLGPMPAEGDTVRIIREIGWDLDPARRTFGPIYEVEYEYDKVFGRLRNGFACADELLVTVIEEAA